MKVSLKGMRWDNSHGLSGVAVLVLGLMEFGRILVNKRPAAPQDAILLLLVATSCSMMAGLFSPLFQDLRRKLGKTQFIFLRAGFWQMAFSGLLLTPFCQQRRPSSPQFTPQDVILLQIGLLIWGLGTFAALCLYVYEFCRCILRAGTSVIDFWISNAVLLGVPAATWWLGVEEMQRYDEMYNISSSLYAVSLVTSFATAWDAFFLGLNTSGRISFADLKLVGSWTWSGVFGGGVATLLGRIHASWLVAVVAYVTILFLYALSLPVERLLLRWGIARRVEKGKK